MKPKFKPGQRVRDIWFFTDVIYFIVDVIYKDQFSYYLNVPLPHAKKLLNFIVILQENPIPLWVGMNCS